MKIFKKIKIGLFLKFMLISCLTCSAFFSFCWFFLLPAVETTIMNAKREHLENLVEMPYSILDGLNRKVEKGEMSIYDAKQAAKTILRTIKYDDKNYIFIFNEDKMLIHSDDTTREEKPISMYRDAANVHYLENAITMCAKNEQGSGFMYYLRAKPNSDLPQKKLSFVKLYKPWNYYIGTGFYLDDINEQLGDIKFLLIYMTLALLLVIFIVVFYFTRNITNPIVELTHAAKKFAEGEYRVALPIVKTNDETADLSNSFNIMQKELGLTMSVLQSTAEKLQASNKKLEAINFSLESKVKERTKELTETKELLEMENDARMNLIIELNLANQSKDKFLSIIAHDLKNPLGSFKQIAELLSNSFDKLSVDERNKLISLLDHSSKKVYVLLENLLEWSRSQRGLIKYEPTTINLFELVETSFEILEGPIQNKKITVKNAIPKDYLAYVDVNMMTTVFRNLISNAIKFSPIESELVIKARRLHENSKDIIVSIIDKGIGIREIDIPKLFRIDVLKSEIESNGEQGSGLGLILCKEFIERHGGKIWVESEIGKGSTFSFSIESSD